MTPRLYAVVAGLSIALVVLGLWLAASAPGPGAGSAVSLRPDGWLAARRYLEARGSKVTLMDDPKTAVHGVLVLGFPWQGFDADTRQAPLQEHLLRGGTIVFAYSGAGTWDEPAIAAALGMEHERSKEEPPLHPLRWREWAAASSALVPEAGDGERRPVRVSTPRDWMIPPRGAQVLLRDADGRAAAFSYRRWSGRVFVVPASAFSNARIGEKGNGDFLESLALALGPAWTFDEFHHGLVSASGAITTAATTRALDIALLQLVFVYALGVLAVARRFGPAWNEPPVVAGSTASFLRGIGALHRRFGHHPAAARLLIERAREMHPRVRFPEPAAGGDGDAALLRLAQDVGRAQSVEEKTP
jgi:hypothetical protein